MGTTQSPRRPQSGGEDWSAIEAFSAGVRWLAVVSAWALDSVMRQFLAMCSPPVCFLIIACLIINALIATDGSPHAIPGPAHVYRVSNIPFANWDGQWYAEIAANGYHEVRNAQSNLAFFPLYPLLGRAVAWATGLQVEVALLIVSQASLLAVLFLFDRYMEGYRAEDRRSVARTSLLVFAVFPTSFILGMDYSESLFVLLTTAFLFGIDRSWPPAAVALITGAATACRPVGVGLVPAFALYAWQRCEANRRWRLPCLLLLSAWGILLSMAYQSYAFGDMLAFVRTQSYWEGRHPGSLGEKLSALVTLGPIREVFDRSSPAFLGNFSILSMRFAEPLIFVATVLAVCVGSRERWLSRFEVVTSASLLLIPYITKSYENYMGSMGRHASVAIPVYIVFGRGFAHLPRPMMLMWLLASALLMYRYCQDFFLWK